MKINPRPTEIAPTVTKSADFNTDSRALSNQTANSTHAGVDRVSVSPVATQLASALRTAPTAGPAAASASRLEGLRQVMNDIAWSVDPYQLAHAMLAHDAPDTDGQP